MNAILYIHGKGGCAMESEHYKLLFPDCEVIIHTDFGEDLSWEYLSYVRSHPIEWRVPTQILYGSNDHLMSIDTITDYANKHQAPLAVMQGGEHWFHTEEQMMFLDHWMKKMETENN